MWPRFGIIIDRPLENFNPTTPASGSGSVSGSFPSAGGGSTGGAAGNALNASVVFSNMEIKYYKINLESTKTNMYGESVEKWYYYPISVKCILERGELSNSDDEFGVNTAQTITATITRDFAAAYNLLPEVGDIIMDREKYYEISSIDVSFITIPGTGAPNGTQGTTGETMSYKLTGHLTRTTKLNIIPYYQ